MSWFRVDDSFTDHPKVRSIPRADRKAAVGLWTLAGSYAARQLTDGFIFTDDVIDLGCAPKDAAALVKSGLWHARGHDCGRCAPVPQGQYLFHDWLMYQRSRAWVLAEREKAAERQRIAREKAKSQRDSGVTNDEVSSAVTVPPSHPIPSPSSNQLGGDRPEPLRAVADTSPPKCAAHPLGDFDGPCGGCKRVREYGDRNAEQAKREALAAAANCPYCHGTNWREDDDGNPTRKCDHRRTA